MTLNIYNHLEQGSDEWRQARAGLLTASTIGQLLTGTGKRAQNDKSRALVMSLLAERITRIVEDSPMTFAMTRGHEDEVEAKLAYAQEIAPIQEVGFMTEDRWGVKLGYSPDGLVGDDGLIECKSKCHKKWIEAVIDQKCPDEHMAQIQCGLLVSGRAWCDLLVYPAMGGAKMMIVRVLPDLEWQERLLSAAMGCEAEISERAREYEAAMHNTTLRFLDTERRQDMEIF